MAHDAVRLADQLFTGKAGERADQVVGIGDVALQVGGGDHRDVLQGVQQLGVVGGVAHRRVLVDAGNAGVFGSCIGIRPRGGGRFDIGQVTDGIGCDRVSQGVSCGAEQGLGSTQEGRARQPIR
ncbi:hypothetical protein G6F31_014651 [Rhizopus arrhizus]|nr:hypothetical protein G6F31_014651 [Rhizopus arrhizus]